MIPLSTNIKQKYNLIYFKLIELKGLLKEKLEECHVNWEACINDPNNDITAELLAENKASFTQLIKCLVHIDSYAPHKEITDYNGYQIHNNSITYLDETNSDYYQNKTIHTKDYILIDKIYYYMSFLRWFLREMNVSQYDINEARTLKELILLLDKVIIYENVEFIIPTNTDNNETDEITMYTDIKNSLNYYFISSKTKQEVDIPLYTLQCTSENTNVSFQITDVQDMNWRVEDKSYQIQDGVEYWIYDFYLYADNPIPNEQFYDIRCNYGFLLVNVVRTEDKQGLHIYSTPYAYPKLGQDDLFRIQLPKHIVKGKIYDMIEVRYKWGEYTLMYPWGKTDTGFFIKPIITENLPQDIECTLTFNGYQQYKPLTTNFTITVRENPFIMDPITIKNNNDISIYYESENEGYNTDEWQIDVYLKNYKDEPIISKEIYLQIEDEEPFTNPLITDMNGYAQYIGTIPYLNSDFIMYDAHMPDAIKFFIRDGEIDYSDSSKIYYQEIINQQNYTVTKTETSEPLTNNEITEQIIEVGKDDNKNPITKKFYYYVYDENHKYKIDFDTSQTLVLGEIYDIQYPPSKNDLELKIYTTGDPAHDTHSIKNISLYHEPIIVTIPSEDNINVGSEITIIVTFCNVLTGQPLTEHIYDSELVYISIGSNNEDQIGYTVSNSQASRQYIVENEGINEIFITIHNETDEKEVFKKEFKAKGEVILDGNFISNLSN